MISERDISEKFSAIWKKNFPLLTPNFIKIFNSSQIEQINKVPVSTIEDVRYDLVSETAFILSDTIIENNISYYTFVSDTSNIQQLFTKTVRKIWPLSAYENKLLDITNIEIQEVVKISKNILEFISKIGGKNIEFRPKLKGYGFIPDLEGDLSIDDTLYEIKTVTRNFKSSDIKQLFIYLSLRQLSDVENWKYAGLYNPRKGVYCKFKVKSLITNLTGGNSPNEVFENLLNGLVRDIELDSRF